MSKVKNIEFQYGLSGVGWSEGLLVLDGQEMKFEISYLCAPIDDLLDVLIELNRSIALKNYVDSIERCTLTWVGEPWGYKLEFACDLSNWLEVTAHAFNDIEEPSTSTQVIHRTCKLDDFTLAVMTELDTLIKRKGLINYLQEWRYPFPVTDFIRLKRYLVEKNLWISENQTSADLINEIQLLEK